MTPRFYKMLSALLLALATVPALAAQADSTMFGQPFVKLAQLGPDERRALRERWEQASPEERMRMRQFFQDRMRQLPPEAQEAIRIPFPGAGQREYGRERTDKRRGKQSSEGGFGFGFEKRHFEDGQTDHPGWSGERRPEDDERR